MAPRGFGRSWDCTRLAGVAVFRDGCVVRGGGEFGIAKQAYHPQGRGVNANGHCRHNT
jgi:hypothetical protein